MVITPLSPLHELHETVVTLLRRVREVVPSYGEGRLYLQDIRVLREAAGLDIQRRQGEMVQHVFPRPGGRLLRLQTGLPLVQDRFLSLRAIARALDAEHPSARGVHEAVALIGVFSGEERKLYGKAWCRQQRRILCALEPAHFRSVFPGLQLLAKMALREIRARAGEGQPLSARAAYDEGMRCRGQARYAEATEWFLLAGRRAQRKKDFEVQALAGVGLGRTKQYAGDTAAAKRWLKRAARVARRHKLRVPYAFALHDLATLAIEHGDCPGAYVLAEHALRAYPKRHPQRVSLAHDIAFLWLERGYFQRSLRVFLALRGHISDHPAQTLLWANVARAAAGVRDDELFGEAWIEAHMCSSMAPGAPEVAEMYLNLAYAAQTVGMWQEAREVATRARDLAETQGSQEVLTCASMLLEAIQAPSDVAWIDPPSQDYADAFAGLLVASFGD